MADKLMCIQNNDKQNYPLSRLKLVVKHLNTQLNEPTNQNSLKSPKLLSQRIRKHYYKTLRTRVINTLLSPFFLTKSSCIAGRLCRIVSETNIKLYCLPESLEVDNNIFLMIFYTYIHA